MIAFLAQSSSVGYADDQMAIQKPLGKPIIAMDFVDNILCISNLLSLKSIIISK
jgi:hypothetical protein